MQRVASALTMMEICHHRHADIVVGDIGRKTRDPNHAGCRCNKDTLTMFPITGNPDNEVFLMNNIAERGHPCGTPELLFTLELLARP
ncbi:hypothetical protein J6590_078642 [Homalodisca vitripennis]|nr:hypothetical protein J6590_078642 [Homalodisca vitripennis]